MATDEEYLRKHLIGQVVDNVPRGCLEEFERRAQKAYVERFAEVRHDPATLDEHRLHKLIQDRMFRMDWELAETAKAQGLRYTAKPLPENTWAYTYVIAGSFGLTQAYVQTIGALPIPAKYRDDLAKASGIPRLPLDDPREIYQPKKFYALLAHNPVGRHFAEEDQKLGTLQLCIPCRDMNSWAFAMSVPELLSYYPNRITTQEKERGPAWKGGARPLPKRDTEMGE